ncbi:MAG: hypothetical protein GY841_03835 [FCB group bacterium]|nr:hypothetical protein [FCB group bacterium]
MAISSLIDKQDNFEIIRDEVAAILAIETASQQALATAGGKDPDLWKFRVFIEQSNPLEQYLNAPLDTSPIVNVFFDTESFNKSHSNMNNRQKAEGIINIDCYGYAVSADNPGGGHIPGDRGAAYEVQRAARLVRNIIMAEEYDRLGLPLGGPLWSRWISSIDMYQQPAETNVQNVASSRLQLQVEYNELSPQTDAEVLELLSATVKRFETGEIYFEADFDYT